jgi:adenosylmethionine-8-amino-7-oxononanoate aminotransferase
MPLDYLQSPPSAAATTDPASGVDLQQRHLLDYPGRARPVAVAGEGAWVTDACGRRYLDAAFQTLSIGHGVPEVADAIAAQIGELAWASPRFFVTQPALQLAEEIATVAPAGLGHTLVVPGGTEAVEAACQTAAYWQQIRGKPAKVKFISQWGSFHGGTGFSISLGGYHAHRERMRAYELPPSSMLRAPATPADGGDPAWFAAELEKLIVGADPSTVCAVVVEPMSATTLGAVVPTPGWHQAIRAVCDRHDVLLIADEVSTGFGRTGRWWGMDHWQTTADMIVAGKNLYGGYVPLGVVIASDRIAGELQARGVALPVRFTSGGNPVSCAAGLAVLRFIKRERLVARARRAGRYLQSRLRAVAEANAHAGAPRGLGMLVGVPLWAQSSDRLPFPRGERVMERVVRAAQERHGLLIAGGTGSASGPSGDHITITPPLTASWHEIDILAEKLVDTLDDVLGSGHGGSARRTHTAQHAAAETA